MRDNRCMRGGEGKEGGGKEEGEEVWGTEEDDSCGQLWRWVGRGDGGRREWREGERRGDA